MNRILQLTKDSVPISRKVARFPSAEWAVNNDGQRRIPIGEVWISGRTIYLNKSDLIGLVEDQVHAMGCCGPCGREYTHFTPQGLPVGKEFADCWSSHYVEIDTGDVEIEFFDEGGNYFTWVGMCTFQGRELIVDRMTGTKGSLETFGQLCLSQIDAEIDQEPTRSEAKGSLRFVDITDNRQEWIDKGDEAFLWTKYSW